MTEYTYTTEELEEIKKCMNPNTGHQYFIENYFRIEHPSKGPTKFELSRYHNDALSRWAEHRFCFDLVGKMMDKKSLQAAYALWCALFLPNFTIGILTDSDDGVADMLKRIRYSHDNLPDFLVDEIETCNKRSLSFINSKSYIRVERASITGLRGLGVNLLMLDDMGNLDSSEFNDIISSLIPVISTSAGFISSSVKPHDGHSYLDIWEDSYSNSGSFNAEIYPYTYNGDVDDEWVTMELCRVDRQTFDREYMCR